MAPPINRVPLLRWQLGFSVVFALAWLAFPVFGDDRSLSEFVLPACWAALAVATWLGLRRERARSSP